MFTNLKIGLNAKHARPTTLANKNDKRKLYLNGVVSHIPNITNYVKVLYI